MKRLALAAVTILVFGAAGCGSKSPAAPSDTTIFTAQLSALNENPPITDGESTARGTAVITINKATNQVDFSVSLNSFPAGSVLNNAHIHNGAAGINAGVFVPTGLTTATLPTITNGSATFSVTVTATADQVSQILANPAGFYFNVHSVLHGAGVMRGQLQ
jgi:CHRD domain